MPAVQQSATDGLGLLLVDMQDAFLRTISERACLVRRCRLAVSAATLLGIPVAITEQVPRKLGPTLPELSSAAADACVFPKTAFSALAAEGVEAWLENFGITHLLIAGIETPVCIYQTALDAAQRGLAATVLTDCVGARRPADAAAAIAFLTARTQLAFVPCESLFYSLIHHAQHPLFRQWTQLVKEASC